MKTAQLAVGAALVASCLASPARGSPRYDSSPLYPDGLRQQSPISESRPYHDHAYHDNEGDLHHEHWWNPLPSSKEHIKSLIDGSLDHVRSGLDTIIDTVEDVQGQLRGHLTEAVDALPTLHRVQSNGGYHDFPDLTIYQLISLSNYTTKFYKLVSEYPDIVDTLNSTSANYTLFVPIDSAFEHLPDCHHHKGKDGKKKPSKEFIESVLKYHIGLDVYNARRILTTHTLPTTLNEKLLGKEPQRLRTSVGLGGVRINFYSKVVAADIGAKNGVIHGVGSILVPPPVIGRLISLFPSEFSTLLLAYVKTDFVEFIHHVKMVGSTVFVPSNFAFARLGIRTNAFLFNTDTGLKYLKAILKYHIAPNATLYSDAFYDETGKSGGEPGSRNTEHFDLETLLPDTRVSVDIATLAAFKTIRVNGFSYVTIADGIGKNGAVHVIDKVLIPPCKHKHGHGKGGEAVDGPIEPEELMERFSDYVD